MGATPEQDQQDDAGTARSTGPVIDTRRIFRVCALVAVSPIAVAAVRNGLQGWEPTWDAATTAVRIRDVFSAHPPLYGLVAAPASNAHPYSYLGALEFYLLAPPVKLLGTTWGLLLGIAALNITALLVALWLIRRRVGDVAAIVAAAFVASLLWSLGSEFIVDPTPVQAVTLSFFTLLVAAWSVADGDAPALVVLAVVGNYLVLTHLTMVFVAPLVAASGLLMWLFYLRGIRHEAPSDWSRERRHHLRWLAGGIAVTIAVWIPPLYEQFLNRDGNIGRLVGAVVHGSGSAVSATWSGALGVVTSVTAVPPFWLPPSFTHPPFDAVGGGQAVWMRIVGGTVLALCLGAVVLVATRRRDNTIRRGTAIAAMALIGWMVTWRLNPGADSAPMHYFWGLWPLAAFAWFVMAVGVARALAAQGSRPPAKLRRIGLAGCGVLVLVTTLIALPERNNCQGRCANSLEASIPVAREIRSATADFARSHAGPVQIETSPGAAVQFEPALLLGLQDAGSDGRVSGSFFVRQFGVHRSASRGDAAHRLQVVSADETPPPGERLGHVVPQAMITSTRYRKLQERMQQWVENDTFLSDVARRQLGYDDDQRVYRLAARLFVAEQGHNRDLAPLARFIVNIDAVGLSPRGLSNSGLSRDELRAWATETVRRRTGGFVLYATSLE